jgi:ATP-dependent Clp protease protease subunit
MNIDERLELRQLDAGVIYMSDDISDYDIPYFSKRLHHATGRVKDIVIHMTSPGGSVYSALAMYDIIRGYVNNGYTIRVLVEGYAASAAAMIVLQAASVRQARPSSRFLLHEVSKWKYLDMEKLSTAKDEVKELETLSNTIFKIMAERCTKTEREIKAIIERKEVWMSAEEALAFGLIDEII